jgi:hypothetical protein
VRRDGEGLRRYGCRKGYVLAQYELFKGEAYVSEILEAVRNATPESKAAFEERFGPIAMTGRIIAGGYQRGWVREYRLLEDGTVEEAYYEGGSPEARAVARGSEKWALGGA